MKAKTLIVQRLDGTTYDLNALDIRIIKFSPPSANYTHNSIQVGKYGERLVGTTIGKREIPISMDVFASNNQTIIYKRNLFFQIFSSMEDFFIIDARIPTIRWRVRAEQQPFEFYDNYHMGGDISFNLVCVGGFAESIASTLEIEDLSKWSITGMNLPINKPLKYKFTTSEFDVYNASNIDIMAEEKPYKIIFKGSAGGLSITNATTDQTFTLSSSIGNGDEFYLEGPFPFLNGNMIYPSGNHSWIDLAQGWNHFKISGYQGDFEVSFDTHFYY